MVARLKGKAVATIVGGKRCLRRSRSRSPFAFVLVMRQPFTAQGPTAPQRDCNQSQISRQPKTSFGKDHDRFVTEIDRDHRGRSAAVQRRKAREAIRRLLASKRACRMFEIDAEGNVIGVRKGIGKRTARSPSPRISTRCFRKGPTSRSGVKARSFTRRHWRRLPRSQSCWPSFARWTRRRSRPRATFSSSATSAKKGPGDLRGMKYLFQKGTVQGQIKMFISLDPFGAGNDITIGGDRQQAIQSDFQGAGGHSFGSFGLVSPAYALGNAMLKLSKMQVPSRPQDDVQCRRHSAAALR